MMVRGDNLAYDLSLFDTEEIDRKMKQNKRERFRVVETPAAKRGNMLKIILSAACCVGIALYFLASKVTISELALKIDADRASIETLKMENERLQTELENIVSLAKVEDYAVNELGLTKIGAGQQHYITLDIESMAEVNGGAGDNVFVMIHEWFAGILEYLGL